MPPLRSLRSLAAAALLCLSPAAAAQVGTPGGAGDSGDPELPRTGSEGGVGGSHPGPGDGVSAPASGSGRGGPELSGDPPAPGPAAGGGPGAAPAGPVPSPIGTPRPANPLSLAGRIEATSWRVWWRLNRDPYLRLKDAVHAGHALTGDDEFFLGAPGAARDATGTLTPTRAELERRVLPALLEVLEAEPGNELRREVLMALARVGVGGELIAADRLTGLAIDHLESADQRVVEAAVIALGLSGDFRALALLNALVAANEDGARDLARAEVPRRVRALAAYAMGLAAARSDKVDVRRYVVRHLALRLDSGAERELGVACVTAIGLAPLPVRGIDYDAALDTRDAGGATREGQVAWLVYHLRHERLDPIARAHVPTAMARLFPGLGREWKDVYVDELRAGLLRSSTSSRELRQSCAQALGMIGDADEDEADHRIRVALETALGDADLSTRFFALIGLARAGGRPGDGAGERLAGTARARRTLLDQLERGKSGARPWAALALGVLGRGLIDAGRYPELEVSEALLAALEDARSPEEVGACAIALGLRRDGQARGRLEERLAEQGGDDSLAAELALALGMLDAGAAQEPLWELTRGSLRRPYVLLHGSIGLALLGAKDVVTELGAQLETAGSLALQTALADTLGFVGDERALKRVCEELRDEEDAQFARAAYARALGRMAERDDLPWATPLSVGVNYRAATELLAPPAGGGLADWD